MSFVEVLPAEPVMPTTRAPLRSRTAPPSARSRGKPLSGARDLAIVERHRLAGRLLALLVPLAGDEHDIPGARGLDRLGDRRRPVGLDLDCPPDAFEHLADDRVRVFAARVVGGDDGEVAPL